MAHRDLRREREGAALAGLAVNVDLATHHLAQPGRDAETEAGSAVSPRRRTVGLLEGLEDGRLLVLGDPDSGIPHGEADFLPREANGHGDLAALGELDRVA